MNQQNKNFSNVHAQSTGTTLLNEESLDLRPLLLNLWANKWLLITTAVVCMFFACVYISLKVPIYSANVLLQGDAKNTNKSILGDLGLSLPSQSSSAAVQTVLIKSRYMCK